MMMQRFILSALSCAGAAILFSACATGSGGGSANLKIEKAPFGKTPDGRDVTQWTLSNSKGMRVKLIDWGATNVSLEVPDRDGKIEDVILGCETVEGYIKSPYFGCVAGRYANRIANAKFSLDGREYQLQANDPPHTLHGGKVGFNKRLWRGAEIRTNDSVGVAFTLLSEDGDEGYPGNLGCSIKYLLTDNNELTFLYEGTTDKPTVVNLTQHNYYNLAGHGNGDILGHQLKLGAANYTPADKTMIPTGKIDPVAGTPLDFTQPHAIGERIAQVPGGYDHNFVIDGAPGKMRFAAKAVDPKSGRAMEIWTDEAGIQFYTGNFLDGTAPSKGGKVYNKNFGFCLETQKYPDSPNKPEFPSPVLRPGERYSHRTTHRFYVEK